MDLFRQGACLSVMDFKVVLKQLTRSTRWLGVLSSNSEVRRSFLNLGRLIDLIFRNHTSLAEDSDLEPFKLNNTVAWSGKKEPEIDVSWMILSIACFHLRIIWFTTHDSPKPSLFKSLARRSPSFKKKPHSSGLHSWYFRLKERVLKENIHEIWRAKFRRIERREIMWDTEHNDSWNSYLRCVNLEALATNSFSIVN